MDAHSAENLLQRYAEAFCKDWAPSDPRDAAAFHASLYHLIHLTHRAAAEPFTKMMSLSLATTPFPVVMTTSRNGVLDKAEQQQFRP
jgi:hypothetical protein